MTHRTFSRSTLLGLLGGLVLSLLAAAAVEAAAPTGTSLIPRNPRDQIIWLGGSCSPIEEIGSGRQFTCDLHGRRIICVGSAIGLWSCIETSTQMEVTYFTDPVVDEINPSPRVDYCLDGDSGCGAPAAHAFCERYVGAGRVARAFEGDGIATSIDDPTWQIGRWYPRQPYGTGEGFSFIECVDANMSLPSGDVPDDGDDDGVTDSIDNCRFAANPLQENYDGDLYGDVCDPEPELAFACSNGIDDDGDGFVDAQDSGCFDYDDDSEGAPTLDDALVGYWPMDGDLTDASVNGLDGTNLGATPTTDLAGGTDAAMHFDGGAFADLGNDPALERDLPVTIAALVRPECGGRFHACTLFNNDADPLRSTGISLRIGIFGWLEAAYGDGGPRGASSRRRATTLPLLGDGQWHHVAVVIHGPTDFRFFVDGAQLDRNEIYYDGTGGSLAYSNHSGLIGLDFPLDSFAGDMDELRFYGRALNPSEIAAIDPRHCIGAEDLAGLWALTGNGVDSSGCENHGVIQGATPTEGAAGQTNEGYAFDGSDAIDLGRSGVLKPELPATLFLRLKSECPAGSRCFAFENDSDVERYSGLSLQVGPDGRVEVRIGDGGAPGPGNRRSALSDAPLVPGRWVNVAAVVRGPQDIDLYFDGVPQYLTYSGSGGALAYLGGPALIGSHAEGSNGFQGDIDEVQLYHRALSENEIVALPEPGSAIGVLAGGFTLLDLARRRRAKGSSAFHAAR